MPEYVITSYSIHYTKLYETDATMRTSRRVRSACVAAFFDVDGTILSCQSGTLYIGFLRRQGLMDLSA